MAIVRVDTETGEIKPRRRLRFVKAECHWGEVIAMGVFSNAECKVLLGLSAYLQFRTNAIADKGHLMSIGDMAAALNLDAGNMTRYVKALMRKNAIGRWSSGGTDKYVMNPALFESGHVDPAVRKFFQQERDKHLANGQRAVYSGRHLMTVVQ